MAAQAFDQPRSAYGGLQVFLGAGVGVVAGVALTGLPLPLQFFVGGMAGLVIYWGVPTLWACGHALHAPYAQRDLAITRANDAGELAESRSREFVAIRQQLEERTATLDSVLAERASALTERDEAQAEVNRLTAPRAFPDVAIDVPSVSQNRRPAGWGNVEVPVIATNRSEERVSLEFHLAIFDPVAPQPSRVRCFQKSFGPATGDPQPPLSIAPKDTANASLNFPVSPEQLARVRAKAIEDSGGVPPLGVPLGMVYLEVRDRVSDTYLNVRLPTIPSAPPS
jgi:hypothetical protein